MWPYGPICNQGERSMNIAAHRIRLTAPAEFAVYADVVPGDHPIRTVETHAESLDILRRAFEGGDANFHFKRIIHKLRFIEGTRPPMRPKAITSLRRRPPIALLEAMRGAFDVHDGIAILHRSQLTAPLPVGYLEPLISIFCRRFPGYLAAPERPAP
jgi:hypothetical protein